MGFGGGVGGVGGVSGVGSGPAASLCGGAEPPFWGVTGGSPPGGDSVRQRAEGHRVACPGEVLPFDVAAGARRGNHVVSALVDSHVVDVAVRVAVDVEEHQVAAPGPLLADGSELEELGLRGALDALAEVAVDVLGETRAVEPGRAGPPVAIADALVLLDLRRDLLIEGQAMLAGVTRVVCRLERGGPMALGLLQRLPEWSVVAGYRCVRLGAGRQIRRLGTPRDSCHRDADRRRGEARLRQPVAPHPRRLHAWQGPGNRYLTPV